MDKIIEPFINLARANMVALVRGVQTCMEFSGQQDVGQLWRKSIENQAWLVREYNDQLLEILSQSQLRMSGQVEKLSERSRHVTNQLTHTAVRSVAIATQARRERPERRVFPLPLPNERRASSNDDRRQALLTLAHHA